MQNVDKFCFVSGRPTNVHRFLLNLCRHKFFLFTLFLSNYNKRKHQKYLVRSEFASVTECDGLLLVPGNPFPLTNRSNSSCPGSHSSSASLKERFSSKQGSQSNKEGSDVTKETCWNKTLNTRLDSF